MALTESNMLPLGTPAPPFTLPNVTSEKDFSYPSEASNKGSVVMFICNHCPFVIHVNEEMVRIAQDYSEKGIEFIAISSNDVKNYPQDDPEKMKIHAEENNYPFPYLYDESQEVARAYDAACTPDFYIFDQNQKLYYRGRMDGSRPGNDIPISGEDLREALDLMIAERSAPEKQYPSAGCNIKWK